MSYGLYLTLEQLYVFFSATTGKEEGRVKLFFGSRARITWEEVFKGLAQTPKVALLNNIYKLLSKVPEEQRTLTLCVHAVYAAIRTGITNAQITLMLVPSSLRDSSAFWLEVVLTNPNPFSLDKFLQTKFQLLPRELRESYDFCVKACVGDHEVFPHILEIFRKSPEFLREVCLRNPQLVKHLPKEMLTKEFAYEIIQTCCLPEFLKQGVDHVNTTGTISMVLRHFKVNPTDEIVCAVAKCAKTHFEKMLRFALRMSFNSIVRMLVLIDITTSNDDYVVLANFAQFEAPFETTLSTYKKKLRLYNLKNETTDQLLTLHRSMRDNYFRTR